MSRIDEAMRRAGADPPHHDPAVSSPWDVEGDEKLGTRPLPGPTGALTAESEEEEDEPQGGFSAPVNTPSLALFKGFQPALHERLVAGSAPNHVLTEQFRHLAATLHHAQVAQNIHVVMVASAVAGEGKTLTATNLALTLSESYQRNVLLVDADLRRPSLHEVFQVPNIAGLNDGLQAPVDRKLALLQVTERLTLLLAGRPNPDPMSSLTSPRMKQILSEAALRFDWVIVDTPPLALMADANLLAAMVDVALVVVRAGQTPFELVERTVETIGRDRVLGVVLNAAAESELQQDYYGYRGYGREHSSGKD